MASVSWSGSVSSVRRMPRSSMTSKSPAPIAARSAAAAAEPDHGEELEALAVTRDEEPVLEDLPAHDLAVVPAVRVAEDAPDLARSPGQLDRQDRLTEVVRRPGLRAEMLGRAHPPDN